MFRVGIKSELTSFSNFGIISTTMRSHVVLLALMLSGSLCTYGQYNNGFPYGRTLLVELDMSRYEPDTSAVAVVLDEFGEAYVDNGGNNNILLEYHVKIKVLRKEGLSEANFSIPLYRNGDRRQQIISVQGRTASLENGKMKETELDPKKVMTERYSEHFDRVAFTLPDVRVGSVFEVKYTLESPFFWNFWPWKFQSDLPKRQSVFWARIPANYNYNISLKGPLKFTRQESVLVKECYTPGGGNKADCSLLKFTMIHIPAFVEEDYMTAKSNYLAALHFELTDVKAFDGRVFRYTKTWESAVDELMSRDDFGNQLKKAKKLYADVADNLTRLEPDSLKKAAILYSYFQHHFLWNEEESYVTELGVKEAFEKRKGNVADINLSMIGAMEAIGLTVFPLLASTRENGIPTQLYPVLSEFDYVVAYLLVGGKKLFLDAAYPGLPMGMLPFKCLNGQGRVIAVNPLHSVWISLASKEKSRKSISMDGQLQADGQLKAKVTILSFGYEALRARQKKKSVTEDEYIKTLSSNPEITITNYRCTNATDVDLPLSEELDIVWSSDTDVADFVYFNPFLFDRWEKNPFNLRERNYPVDFGAPIESILSMNLRYSPEFTLQEAPAQQAYGLPQNGGRFLYNVTQVDGRVTATSNLNLSRTTYAPAEYFNLKELFSRIVQLHGTPLVFVRKK